MVDEYGRGNNVTDSIKITLRSQCEGEAEVHRVDLCYVNAFRYDFNMVPVIEAIYLVFLSTLMYVLLFVFVARLDSCIL